MSAYKLGYFNTRGRGEGIRYTFAAAGVDYEDLRFDSETWRSTYKETTPFGVAPFLLVDGKMLSDSGAILRYLGKKFGMMGGDEWEEAMVNQTMGICDDVSAAMIKIHFADNQELKEKLLSDFKDNILPKLCKYIEKTLKTSGFLIGDKVTVADIGLASLMDYPGILEAAPEAVKGFYDKVMQIPGIAKWRKERPEQS